MSDEKLKEIEDNLAQALAARGLVRLMAKYLDKINLLDDAMPTLKEAIAIESEQLIKSAHDGNRNLYIKMQAESLRLLSELKD